MEQESTEIKIKTEYKIDKDDTVDVIVVQDNNGADVFISLKFVKVVIITAVTSIGSVLAAYTFL